MISGASPTGASSKKPVSEGWINSALAGEAT